MSNISRTRTHILFSEFLNADVKVKVKTAPHLDAGGKPAVVITVSALNTYTDGDETVGEYYTTIMHLGLSIRSETGVEVARGYFSLRRIVAFS